MELLSAANDPLLTDRDVERVYGIPRGSLRQWRARGRGPQYIRFGERTVRYRTSAIEQFIAERTVNPGAA